MKNDSQMQQKRLKDLKKEYEDIEQKCKTKIIDDLANLYYKKKPVRDCVELDDNDGYRQKKLIKSRSINIEILEDGSVCTSKVIRSKTDSNNVELEDDESLDKSITISINSKSSRRSQNSRQKSANVVATKKPNEDRSFNHNKEVSDDVDDDDCDTLNAIENISVHDDNDLLDSNSILHEENTNIKNENEALRKKYKKYKLVKNKLAQSNLENDNLKKDVDILKHDLAKLLKENTELKLKNSVSDSSSRHILQQNSIHEAPVRDSKDQGIQVAMTNNEKSNFSSFEVDYFTEVIIDELKKEIRELKGQMKEPMKNNKDGDQFKMKEESILLKLSKMKLATEKLKTEASKSHEESSTSSEIEKLKVEIDNLKKMLDQEHETNATYESYIGLLKQSYTSMFGPLGPVSTHPTKQS